MGVIETTSLLTSSERISQVLELFNIETLHPEQEILIEASLAGKDVLGILPTGYGKSICYQLPGIVRGELTIVVSPLIALQEDQVQTLRRNGIDAFAFHSNLDQVKLMAMKLYFRRRLPGRPCFLYVAPETLLGNDFRDLFRDISFERIAVDEAHCVSTWGNGFRPLYQRIGEFIQERKIPHRSAFTATVDAKIERDIMDRIPLREGFVRVEASPFRENLSIKVERVHAARSMKSQNGQRLLNHLYTTIAKSEYLGPTLVYFNSRDKSAKLYEVTRRSEFLKSLGFHVYLFHAQLPYEDKQMALEGFLRQPRPIVFATSAFGLGVNRADVRQVIHFNAPYTLIDYAQQVGRGGRDGKPTLCTSFFDPDSYNAERPAQITSATPDIRFVDRVLRTLHTSIARLTPEKRLNFTLNSFFLRMRSIVESTEEIARKEMHMDRIMTSVAMLQRIGLIRFGSCGMEVDLVVPGTPPHRRLLEMTQMNERMVLREYKRLGEFFLAENPDQSLLWKIIARE